jgi:hypothetical protein
VFDDPTVRLKREPFVAGMGEIIDALVADIQHADRGFTLLFSAAPFPGARVSLTRLHAEHGGTWYQADTGRVGWLCPALFLYFETAPEKLYAQATP